MPQDFPQQRNYAVGRRRFERAKAAWEGCYIFRLSDIGGSFQPAVVRGIVTKNSVPAIFELQGFVFVPISANFPRSAAKASVKNSLQSGPRGCGDWKHSAAGKKGW